jgi:hypothetical protein
MTQCGEVPWARYDRIYICEEQANITVKTFQTLVSEIVKMQLTLASLGGGEINRQIWRQTPRILGHSSWQGLVVIGFRVNSDSLIDQINR